MSKYTNVKCTLCKGIGMIKKTTNDICSHCNETLLKKCCHCEFKVFRGQYKECYECLGVGEHWIDNKTNKKVLVWCLPK